MAATRCEVSVVVIPRDRPGLLVPTVQSVLDQRDTALEVLLAGISAELPTSDPRVLTVDVDPRAGPAAARNAGIRSAGGEWVALLEEGDRWAPDRVRRQLADPRTADAVLAYAGHVVVRWRGLDYALPAAPRGLEERLRTANVVGPSSGVLVRAEALRARGGLDERLAVLDDWRLWIELAGAGPAAACADILAASVYDRTAPRLRFPRRALAELDLLRREGLVTDEGWLRDATALAFDLRGTGRGRQAAAIYLRTALARRRPQDALRAASAVVRATRQEAAAALVGPAWLRRTPTPV
jgi:hypothetical protein